MQWILEHLTEILVGALGALFSIIIALLTYIGNDKISSLEKKTDLAITEIQKTNCELNTLTAKDRLEDFEARFLGRSMEDLTLNSAELERLKGFRDKYSSLGTCVGATAFKARIAAMYDGLIDFIGGDLDGASRLFDELPKDRAITQQLLGTISYRKSLLVDPNSSEARKLRQEADNHTAQFVRLADDEIGGVLKQADIARYDCNTRSRHTSDRTASENALQCLQGLVDKKIADHNTYFNMAEISARLGSCQLAIDNLKLAAQEDAHHTITRSYISKEEDFSLMSKSPECSSQWSAVLGLFR